MTKLEILLAILTTMSGFGNITQWVNIKALRDKNGHEADKAYIENLKEVIRMQGEEIKRLEERVKTLEEKIQGKEGTANENN